MKIAFPLKDTELTASRQIIKSIVADLKALTGIPETVPIVYNERRGVVNVPAGNMGSSGDALRLDSDDRLYVEYSDEPDETQPIRSTLEGEYPAIFSAPKLGIKLVPNHTKTIYTLNLTYRSPSLNTVITWLDTIKFNCRNRKAVHYHDVHYTYTLPEELVAYFYDVHTLTENVAPYGYSLKEFNERHYTKGLIGRQNLSGKKNRLAVNTKVGSVLGRYNNVPDSASTDKERVFHEVQFTYTVEIDKVSRVLLDFQSMVHNQRVPAVYLERFVDPILKEFGSTIVDETITAQDSRWVTAELAWAFVPFEATFDDPYDRWHPPIVQQGTSTMIMIPLEVDLGDLKNVLNLRDIAEGNALWDALYVIFAQFHTRLTEPYAFPITVELYRVGETPERLAISVNDSLDVTSQLDMNPRDRHYLRVSVTWDLRLVFDALDILRQWPAMITTILQILYPNVDLTTVGNGQLVTKDSLLAALDEIYNSNQQFRSPYGIHRVHTVQISKPIIKGGTPNA